jgi:hypothetical protein
LPKDDEEKEIQTDLKKSDILDFLSAFDMWALGITIVRIKTQTYAIIDY